MRGTINDFFKSYFKTDSINRKYGFLLKYLFLLGQGKA